MLLHIGHAVWQVGAMAVDWQMIDSAVWQVRAFAVDWQMIDSAVWQVKAIAVDWQMIDSSGVARGGSGGHDPHPRCWKKKLGWWGTEDQ